MASHNPQITAYIELGRERNRIMNIKYKLADHMRNSMHIPDDMLQHLDIYKMIHWNVPQFRTELKDGQIRNDTLFKKFLDVQAFNVIYHQCTPAAAKSAKEIRLSFRKAKSEFDIEPYVLVQIVQQ